MTELEHKTTIRIPKELHKKARLKALESDVTFSEAVRELLALWVEGEIQLPEDKSPNKRQ